MLDNTDMEKPSNVTSQASPVETAVAQLDGQLNYFDPGLYINAPVVRDEPFAQEAKLLLATAFEEPVGPPVTALPRHKLVSAYIQVAIAKGLVSERDVVIYLRDRQIDEADAHQSIKRHLGGHDLFADETIQAEATRSSEPGRRQATTKFTGNIMLARVVPPELLMSLQRRFVNLLDSESLAAAIVPIADTPYGDGAYVRKMRRIPLIHRHSLNVLSDDTLRICGDQEVVLNEDERLVFNTLLTFGEFGVVPAALDQMGLGAPSNVLKALRTKLNTHGDGVVGKQFIGTIHTHVLQPNPVMIRLRDRRSA